MAKKTDALNAPAAADVMALPGSGPAASEGATASITEVGVCSEYV